MSLIENTEKQFINPQAPYQPRLTDLEYELLKQGRFDDLENSVRSTLGEGRLARCGRLCIDRFALIEKALSSEIPHLSFLDLGCANGMFCIALKALGASRVIGTDNDEHTHTLKIDIPHCLEQAKEDTGKFKLEIEFLDLNLIELIQTHQPHLESDVVMALSVFHHLFLGYGYLPPGSPTMVLGKKTDLFFKWVKTHCRKYLLFETHEEIFADWGAARIADNLTAVKIFESVRCLGSTLGFDGKARVLWLCSP